MPDTIGRITVPTVTPSGTFPLTTRWPYGKSLKRPVVVHTFGSASAKIEQRFFVGSPAERYTYQNPQLSRVDRAALRDFWESAQGSAGAFTYNVPQEDGTTVATTCCFENQPLTFQELTDAITSSGVTLVAITNPASAPTYALTSTVTRFPDATLNPALLQQVQEIVPLVHIRVLDAAVPDIYLSDRRVTIGSQLYLPRLLRIGEPGNEPLITQSIDGSSDDVTFAFGNADRVMVQLANDTQLRWARIELSLFHTATGYKLDLWAGYIRDWHSDAGPEFSVRASDILSALTLSSPAGNISRTCWRRYGLDGCPAVPGSQAMDHTHFPSSSNASCDLGYNTPNGCMAHQVQPSYGGIYATPQGVTIWNNNAASGGGLLRATSLISDTVWGATIPEIWHNDEGVAQWGLPVACKILAGRDESDYFAALGIIGKGPLGALTAPGMWDSDGDGKKDTFIGSTLDGQPNHGYQVDSMGNLKPGANALYGYRVGLGADPAGVHDYSSLGRVTDITKPYPVGPHGWYTNPADGSPMDEVGYADSAYNLVYAAGSAFLELRRTDQAGVQPSLPDSHQLIAKVSQGLTAYTWTAPGSRSTAAGCTNPFWVAINTFLRALGLLNAGAVTQEQFFDVTTAAAMAAIADTSVARIFGTGTEKQFQFKGAIDQRRPTRDWLQLVLNNAAGYYTWSFGKLKVGCRYNASAVSSFTTGNTLFGSLVIQPITPQFEKLTVTFADQEYLFASNTVDYLDQGYATRNNRSQNPFASNLELTGTSSKSQAGRLALIRGREELGGALQAEQDAARVAMLRTTVLALETEAGMVVSIADADIPGATGNFRIQSWRLNRDWSIDITAKSVVPSMYDATVGPKPADVAAAPVPVDPLRDTGVADAPLFTVAISGVDPTEIEVSGLSFPDAANSHTVNAGTFTFYFCDPTAATTTLAANLGSGDASATLASAAGISAGDYLQIGQEIVLCGTPSGGVVPITRAQLGSTAASAASGANVFRLSQRVVAAAIPLDPTNNTDTPNWHVLLSLPTLRVAAVSGRVTNHYGDSPTTNVCVTGNVTNGLVLSGAPPAAPALPASNVTAASVTPLYGLWANASAYGFQINSITLPTSDPSYHQPKFIHVNVTLPDGSTDEICSLPAGTTTYQGPIQYLQDGSSHTLALTFSCENEDGVISASPFTMTVTVSPNSITSVSGADEASTNRWQDATGALHAVEDCTIHLARYPAVVAIWENSPQYGRTFHGLFTLTADSVVVIGAKGSRTSTFPPTKASENRTFTVALGVYDDKTDPSTITGAVTSSAFSCAAPGAPSAGWASGASVAVTYTKVGGAYEFIAKVTVTVPAVVANPNFIGARFTRQWGSYSGGVFTPGPSGYDSAVETAWTDYDPTNAKAFPCVVSAVNNGDGTVTLVVNAGPWNVPSALLADGTANPWTTMMVKIYLASRLDDGTGASWVLAYTSYTTIDTTKAAVDARVVDPSTIGSGLTQDATTKKLKVSYGSGVKDDGTGKVALAYGAGLADDGSGAATVKVAGPIYRDVLGNLNLNMSTDFVTIGGVLTQNAVDLAKAYHLGTNSTDGSNMFSTAGGVFSVAGIAVNYLLAGSALFLGTVVFARSGGGQVTINSSGLTLADNNTSPNATVTIASTGVTVARGSNSVQVTSSGVGIYGPVGSVTATSGGVAITNGTNSLSLTASAITLTNASIIGSTLSLALNGITTTINNSLQYSAYMGLNVASSTHSVSVGADRVLLYEGTQLKMFLNGSGQASINMYDASNFSTTIYAYNGGIWNAGPYYANGTLAISGTGQFVGTGVSCASYGVTCYSVTVGAGGLSVSGSVTLSGTFSGTWSGSFTAGSGINITGTYAGYGVYCPSYGAYFASINIGGYSGYSGAHYIGIYIPALTVSGGATVAAYAQLVDNGTNVGAQRLLTGNGILTGLG